MTTVNWCLTTCPTMTKNKHTFMVNSTQIIKSRKFHFHFLFCCFGSHFSVGGGNSFLYSCYFSPFWFQENKFLCDTDDEAFSKEFASTMETSQAANLLHLRTYFFALGMLLWHHIYYSFMIIVPVLQFYV